MRFSIPKDWRKVKLADIADVQTGIAKGKKNIPDPVTRPYLRVANVQDGHLDLSEIKTIEVSRHEIERFALRDGDVLFTEGGDFDKLGRGTVWQGEIPNCLHQNHVFAVRVKNSQMLPYFLATFAASFWGRTYFLSCSKQTTNLASINSTQLKAMPLPVPPLPEQRRIVEILSTWDRAIEQTEKLIAAKRRLKQGLMQQLLTGKRRFPEFATRRPLKKTKYGPMPADWELVHFDEVATINKESLPESTPQDHTFYYIDLAAVKEGSITLPRTKIRFADAPSRARRLATRGDIVMATVRPNLRGFALPDFDLHEYVFSTGFAIISPKCPDDSEFLYHTIFSPMIARQIHGMIAGSNYPAINGSDVGRLRLFHPANRDERGRIGKALTCVSDEILQLSRYADELRKQKRGLMQKLLTGQVRVKGENHV